MKATLLYILALTFTLFSVCFSIDRIEDFMSEPIQQCSTEFFQICDRENNEAVAGKSVQPFTCHPLQDVPRINHRQCYRTCTYPVDNDLHTTECARCMDGMPKSMSIFETPTQNIYQVRSRGATYDPNVICDYRLKCDSDQSMFYIFLKHELESARLIKDELTCPDALTIFSTGGVFLELCGTELPDRIVLKDQDLDTTFVSNGEKEFGGFFALANCVKDDRHFQKNCVYFDPPRSSRSRDGHDRGKRSFRTPHFTVKPGQVVHYTDYTVTVERVSDRKILHKFKNIRVLQTYNQFESFVTYKKTAGSRFFPGFGKLRIGYGIVQYTQTDIDPRFIPSAEEIRRINILLGNLTDAGFFDDERFVPPDGFPAPGTPGPGVPGATGTPPDDPCSNLDDLPTDLALESINSCNGFLGAAAEFFLEIIAKCNPTPGTGRV